MFDTLSLVFGPGLVAAVLWSPILLSSRTRSLFNRLPPARSTIASSLLVGHPDRRLPGYAMMGFPELSGADLVQEFFLSISDEQVFESTDPSAAAISAVVGTLRE
jgi:cysteine desulfurase